MVELGDRVKDRISGFKGIASSRTVYLYGCVRIGITSEGVDKDGRLKQAEYFDEPQVEVLKTAAAMNQKDRNKHGPREDVRRTPDVRR